MHCYCNTSISFIHNYIPHHAHLLTLYINTHAAALNITQGRITQSPFKLTRQTVVGLATIELSGDSASHPTYFFDCVTDRNNGSGLRWTRSSFPHSFEVDATPDGVSGIRMDVDRIDYPDLDIYICSDQFSDDVARLNITDRKYSLLLCRFFLSYLINSFHKPCSQSSHNGGRGAS